MMGEQKFWTECQQASTNVTMSVLSQSYNYEEEMNKKLWVLQCMQEI